MPRPRPSSGGDPATPQRRRSSFAPPQPGIPQPKMAVLAAANRLRDSVSTPARRSLSGSANQGMQQQQAPLVVESRRYEEWMKIATDNKITSTNTWNLALIDYFHDMSLLRNGPNDSSINFQKASCTLDGCVKIWTSRVDSVANETGKLLSGLGEGKSGADMEDDEDGEGEGGDEDDEEKAQKRAKKRAARAATTLADSFSKLRIKSFDLEFTVDPLFKKTSADFDEGGAAGLLMNHLSVDGGMRVVFDAGDARLEMDEEDQDEETRRELEERRRREEEEGEGEREVPISELFKCFAPSAPSQPLSSRQPVPAPLAIAQLADKSLCPSLASFRFSADSLQSLKLGILNLDINDDDEGGEHNLRAFEGKHVVPSGVANAHLADDDEMGGEGFGGGEDYGGGYYDPGAGRGEVDFFADEFTPQGAYEAGLLPVPPAHLQHLNHSSSSGGGGYGVGPVEAFDPSRAGQGDMVLAMGGEDAGGGGEEGLLEYFDGGFGGGAGGKKGWAGPEHWKMARRRGVKSAAPTEEGTDGTPLKEKKKREKTAFSFDFTAPPPGGSAKELFAPAAPKSSITSAVKKSKKAAGVEEDDNTLPADYGFNSQVLLRLFLKPKMTLRMRRRQAQSLPGDEAGGVAGDADVQFWAQAGMGPGGGGGEGMGMGMEGGEEYGGGYDNPSGGGDDDDFPPPFDTQWLASGDADDDSGPALFDEDNPDGGKELDDLVAATQGQVRRARPETVNYAKRAKRVDVKRLKESIWKELEEVVIEVKQFPKELVYDPSLAPPAPTPSSTARRPPPTKTKKEALVPVVSQLRRQYPKDKMDEISTSYMFICLLHLANEKGLRIQTPAADEAGEGDLRKRVGGLEGLRVLKEVKA
ncbi:hypothetical protein JCM8547_000795 [Rhodosporidiobolus lusitaniae]